MTLTLTSIYFPDPMLFLQSTYSGKQSFMQVWVNTCLPPGRLSALWGGGQGLTGWPLCPWGWGRGQCSAHEWCPVNTQSLWAVWVLLICSERCSLGSLIFSLPVLLPVVVQEQDCWCLPKRSLSKELSSEATVLPLMIPKADAHHPTTDLLGPNFRLDCPAA